MTLQQVQQQEQEMAMRMEHQRQSYLNSSIYGPSSLPSVPTAPTPYMSPGPSKYHILCKYYKNCIEVCVFM